MYAQVYLDVVTPAAYASPAAAMQTAIYFRLLQDELTEFAYPAEVAGLTYVRAGCHPTRSPARARRRCQRPALLSLPPPPLPLSRA